jgi:hypothetical protein
MVALMDDRIQEMAAADHNLVAAIHRSVAADIKDPDVVCWLTLAAHTLPSGEVAVWWAGDAEDAQLIALARSLLDELEGVIPGPGS